MRVVKGIRGFLLSSFFDVPVMGTHEVLTCRKSRFFEKKKKTTKFWEKTEATECLQLSLPVWFRNACWVMNDGGREGAASLRARSRFPSPATALSDT